MTAESVPDVIVQGTTLSGAEPESVRAAMGIDVAKEVDTEDFEAALETAATQRRFALVTDDQELEAIARETEARGGTGRALLRAIVTSPSFRQ